MPTYVRVYDASSGDEFDVREDSRLLRKGLVTRVKGAGVSTRPRPTVHKPAVKSRAKTSAPPEPQVTDPVKES